MCTDTCGGCGSNVTKRMARKPDRDPLPLPVKACVRVSEAVL